MLLLSKPSTQPPEHPLSLQFLDPASRPGEGAMSCDVPRTLLVLQSPWAAKPKHNLDPGSPRGQGMWGVPLARLCCPSRTSEQPQIPLPCPCHENGRAELISRLSATASPAGACPGTSRCSQSQGTRGSQHRSNGICIPTETRPRCSLPAAGRSSSVWC